MGAGADPGKLVKGESRGTVQDSGDVGTIREGFAGSAQNVLGTRTGGFALCVGCSLNQTSFHCDFGSGDDD